MVCVINSLNNIQTTGKSHATTHIPRFVRPLWSPFALCASRFRLASKSEYHPKQTSLPNLHKLKSKTTTANKVSFLAIIAETLNNRSVTGCGPGKSSRQGKLGLPRRLRRPGKLIAFPSCLLIDHKSDIAIHMFSQSFQFLFSKIVFKPCVLPVIPVLL